MVERNTSSAVMRGIVVPPGSSLDFSNAAIVVALTWLAKAIFEGGRGARGGGWGAVI